MQFNKINHINLWSHFCHSQLVVVVFQSVDHLIEPLDFLQVFALPQHLEHFID